MGYDRVLADRIRALLSDVPGVSEKAMFGGLAFLLHGNMAVAASSDRGLLLRVDPVSSETLVAEHGIHRMQMRGRAMDGWLRVPADHVDADADLRRWVELGVGYAGTLPAKKR